MRIDDLTSVRPEKQYGAAAPVKNGGEDFSAVLDSALSQRQAGLERIFAEASRRHGVALDLLKAVAKTESNFNPSATSRCGAMGVMQLMPETAAGLGGADAYDPGQNIMGGAKLLRRLLDRYDGRLELALAAYNAGPANVDKYGGVPPFEETRSYVNIIMNLLDGAAGISIPEEYGDHYSADHIARREEDGPAADAVFETVPQYLGSALQLALQMSLPDDGDEENRKII